MRNVRLFSLAFLAVTVFCACSAEQKTTDSAFVDIIVVSPETEKIEFYWKDEKGEIFKSIGNVKTFVEKQGKKLRFAMNGGNETTIERSVRSSRVPPRCVCAQRRDSWPCGGHASSAGLIASPNSDWRDH